MSKIKLLHCKGPEKKDCLEYPNDIDIYYDDTINDIKRKIIMNANLNVTIDEIYLFGKFKNNIHPDVKEQFIKFCKAAITHIQNKEVFDSNPFISEEDDTNIKEVQTESIQSFWGKELVLKKDED